MLAADDLDELLLIVSDPEVMKHLGVEAGATLSRQETKVTLDKMIEFCAQRGFGRWAVINKEDDKLIGLCGFRLLDKTPELFYVFGRAHWGKGLATEAATAILRYGFEELGFERIVAVTRHGNSASMTVMEKIGLKYEKEVNHSGVEAMGFAITLDEYRKRNSSS